jgi:serine protease Do
VVNISAVRTYEEDSFFEDFFREFFDPYGPRRGGAEDNLGSGVIVSPDGYIITNYHVVADAEEVRVTLYDRRSFKAALVGADPKTDLAVLRIKARGLPTIAWGDSDQLRVGQLVLAVGNPFSLGHTVTMGIVSATGRANVGIADYEDFIQTDAAINPGNSGGPLVNIRGELVGINTAIFSRTGGYQGVGFAVPSNMARQIMKQLIEHGRVVRGWLGVSIQELTPQLAQKFGLRGPSGALVSDVVPGGPAQRAGLQRGDVIVALAGREVREPSALKLMVARLAPGSRVELEFMRQGRARRVEVQVGQYPEGPEQASRALHRPRTQGTRPFSGLAVAELSREVARQLGLKDAQGVLITQVAPASPAARAGLRRGDVIEEMESQRVRTLGDFDRLSRRLSGERTVLLLVNRRGKRFYATLQGG